MGVYSSLPPTLDGLGSMRSAHASATPCATPPPDQKLGYLVATLSSPCFVSNLPLCGINVVSTSSSLLIPENHSTRFRSFPVCQSDGDQRFRGRGVTDLHCTSTEEDLEESCLRQDVRNCLLIMRLSCIGSK